MLLLIHKFLFAFKENTWLYRGIWIYLNHLLSAFYWDCHHCHHQTFPSPLPGGFPWAVHCEHFGAPKIQNDLLSVLTSIKSWCIIQYLSLILLCFYLYTTYHCNRIYLYVNIYNNSSTGNSSCERMEFVKGNTQGKQEKKWVFMSSDL